MEGNECNAGTDTVSYICRQQNGKEYLRQHVATVGGVREVAMQGSYSDGQRYRCSGSLVRIGTATSGRTSASKAGVRSLQDEESLQQHDARIA
jgi:hypothetical protein